MSYQEGFSGAFVEAISLGKPFVSTDVGGAKEYQESAPGLSSSVTGVVTSALRLKS